MSEDGWEYIGDGVYCKFDGFGIILHANSHSDPTDRIYLEPNVLKSLNRFAQRHTGGTNDGSQKE